jgi:hypothetical protein
LEAGGPAARCEPATAEPRAAARLGNGQYQIAEDEPDLLARDGSFSVGFRAARFDARRRVAARAFRISPRNSLTACGIAIQTIGPLLTILKVRSRVESLDQFRSHDWLMKQTLLHSSIGYQPAPPRDLEHPTSPAPRKPPWFHHNPGQVAFTEVGGNLSSGSLAGPYGP